MILTACTPKPLSTIESSSNESPEQQVYADLVLLQGAVYTGNPSSEWAQALAIHEDELIFVGSDAKAQHFIGPDTQILDLEGRMVLPGLHDSHLHSLEASSLVAGTCILEPEMDPEDYIPILRACAPEQMGTDWVLGWGHSLWDLLESERLPIEILDEVIPDQAAVIMEQTSHSVWANSLALEAAGMNGDAPDPPAGIIDRDPDTGEPTGILFENAGNMLFDLALTPNPELAELDYQALLESMKALSSNGITSIAEARTYWKRGHLDLWQKAEREDDLSVRATLGLWAYPHADDEEQLTALKTMHHRDPDSLLQVSQVKLYSDGILHSGTAALLEPYLEDLGISDIRGMNYFEPARLERYVTELESVGFDMHIHTIGDRAVRESLDAIEAARNTNGDQIGARHRLTHLELIHPQDRPRFAALNVIADFQLAGDFTLPEHAKEMVPLIGDRAFDMLPAGSMQRSGARVTLSSDWDVSPLSPFVGMRNALSRGDESFDRLEDVIHAYTMAPAYLMRQEDRTGSLEVGKFADLIVVDRNIFEVSLDDLAETKVLWTLLGGEEMYRAEDFTIQPKNATPTAESETALPPSTIRPTLTAQPTHTQASRPTASTTETQAPAPSPGPSPSNTNPGSFDLVLPKIEAKPGNQASLGREEIV